MKYAKVFKAYLQTIEKTLEEVLPAADQFPQPLHEAMRYAVFPAGKRFRPLLTFAACEALGGNPEDARYAAASLELIHCYSLVHDDLPAMDNDEMRRGRLTCHKKFGEAMALLAGDGLLTLALQILARVQPAKKGLELLHEISTAAGTYGMIGGQVAELVAPPGKMDLLMADFISIHKTGKLIKASVVSGAIAAGAGKEDQKRMLRFGECLGLAFQSIDDLMDQDGVTQFVKPREIRQKVRDLIANAKREIKPFGRRAEKLQMLADYLLNRMPRGKHVAVDR